MCICVCVIGPTPLIFFFFLYIKYPQGLLWLLKFGPATFFWVMHGLLFLEGDSSLFVWELCFQSFIVCIFSICLNLLSFKLLMCSLFIISAFVLFCFVVPLTDLKNRISVACNLLLFLDIMTHFSQQLLQGRNAQLDIRIFSEPDQKSGRVCVGGDTGNDMGFRCGNVLKCVH